MQDHFSRRSASQSYRQPLAEFSSFGLVAGSCLHALLALMEFRPASHAGQAERQTVMGEPRIGEPFAIGDHGAEDRADVQQVLPLAMVARQAGGIGDEDQPCASQTNFSK